MTFLLLAFLVATPSKTTQTVFLRPVAVSADKLSVFSKENRATYLGHVVAQRDATTIRCDEMRVFYDKSQQVKRLEASGHVEIEDGIRQARSDFAEFDNLTGVVVMTGQPEAQQGPIHVAGSKVEFTAEKDVAEVWEARTLVDKNPESEKNGKLFIQSPKMTIFGKKNKAVWSGRVWARRQDTVIESDKATAFYGNDNQLKSVEASHNVVITQKDRWASGEHATYEHSTGVAVLTGSPQARQQGSLVRGTRILFHSEANTVEVENAQTVFETYKGVPKVIEEKK